MRVLCQILRTSRGGAGADDRTGMTLVEVMISLVLLCFLLSAVYQGTNRARWGSNETAQHVAAFGLCRDRFEQMRSGDNFAGVNYANYTTATVRLTHLTGADKQAVMGTISNVIVAAANPSRKDVKIFVSWSYHGNNMTQSLEGTIVDPWAVASVLGYVNGSLKINPNLMVPDQFTVTTTSGGIINAANLTNNYSVNNERAAHITLCCGGADTQTTLTYNFQPQPMANAKQWDLDGTSMKVTIWQPVAASGRYSIRITGADVLLSCH